jgi:predicted alpha/beta-fold hydrolase
MHSLRRARETTLGHVATVSAHVREVLAPAAAPEGLAITIPIIDRVRGTIPIACHLANGGASKLLVIVHGMGGNVSSPYAVRAAREAVDAGWAALRVHLRGASGDGADVYHAGLGDDVAQIVRSPSLARFEWITVVGYSLGGHIVLRHAADGPHDARLRAIAAVCPPIDLDRGSIAIQRLDRRPYQEYVLRSLRRQLTEVRARHPDAVPEVAASELRTIRDWDERVIAPRFGFASLGAFYTSETVGPKLETIRVPTLLVVADRDPMIALDTSLPWLSRASDAVTVARRRRGGHVSFPRDVGLTTARGEAMEREIVRWLDRASA